MATRRIVNTNPVRQLIPSLHLEADPGQTIRVPDDMPLPAGFAEEPADPAEEPAKPASPKTRRKTT